ncbi:MAG: hypothetical protein XU10_C0009G0032 [Chloroflexi bacterium CSP1-4]|nr:MAG: hypothetical protein XU10_C0009G0032 [Chloroflexi bacterium CSP1-4]
MHIRRGYLDWGVFLIVVGAIPLAVRFDWLDAAAVADAWRLWPLIIVGLGVGLILGRTSLAPLGGILVAGTLGIVIGAALAVGPRVGIACVGPGDGIPSGAPVQTGVFSGGVAAIDLHVACGEMAVSTSGGGGWSVDASGWPDGAVDVRGGPASLSVEPENRPGNLFSDRGRARLAVTLPTATTLDLALTVDAGTLRADLGGAVISSLSASLNAADGSIDLSEARVGHFSLSVNAADTDLTLPASATRGSASVNAASLKVCIPFGVGLRVTSSETLASTSFQGGFRRNGDAWESDDWATASERSELTLSVNVGSATVRRGGCD